MSFLGKNINLALVALLLIVILIAVGTTVVYQRGLSQRTSDYEVTSTNLSSCQTQLDNYKERLEKKEGKLQDTSQAIKKYDTLYEQKVSALKDAEGQVSDLQRQLNTITLQKEQFKNLYGTALLNITSLENRVSDLESEKEDLQSKVKNLKDDLYDCEHPSS